ncbi:hypothetical protein [Nocardiopsis ansamitocini]|uniref:Uncharacterized protein n=1 Tax=Nocardiopsis ansamitocini TaxID=1670832 RepID=A0A9W6UHZ3_9ACTN|nr:hypothetical protein [Nocardiopsis ansamitocini]GLU47149.1 hypothetical protein Nans01_15000 [Nocardiopsis ansamitocini]
MTSWQGEEITSSSARDSELIGLVKAEGIRTLNRLAELNPANATAHERALARLSALSVT